MYSIGVEPSIPLVEDTRPTDAEEDAFVVVVNLATHGILSVISFGVESSIDSSRSRSYCFVQLSSYLLFLLYRKF